MSQKLVRSLLISGGLLLILILIIAVNNMILIQGPYFKQLSDDQRIHRQLMQQLRSTDGELLGRYALNEVTYISRVSLYGENWIYWYDAEGNVRAVLRRSQIDEQGKFRSVPDHAHQGARGNIAAYIAANIGRNNDSGVRIDIQLQIASAEAFH